VIDQSIVCDDCITEVGHIANTEGCSRSSQALRSLAAVWREEALHVLHHPATPDQPIVMRTQLRVRATPLVTRPQPGRVLALIAATPVPPPLAAPLRKRQLARLRVARGSVHGEEVQEPCLGVPCRDDGALWVGPGAHAAEIVPLAWRTPPRAATLASSDPSGTPRGQRRGKATGGGEDNGIDRNKNWLRFPYDSTFLRSHSLHPHP
jgi:hypothetical protein